MIVAASRPRVRNFMLCPDIEICFTARRVHGPQSAASVGKVSGAPRHAVCALADSVTRKTLFRNSIESGSLSAARGLGGRAAGQGVFAESFAQSGQREIDERPDLRYGKAPVRRNQMRRQRRVFIVGKDDLQGAVGHRVAEMV